MGGGAGIRFKIGEFANGSETVPVSGLGSVKAPQIQWFDAEGYMDGMDKVDGEILIPAEAEIDFSEIIGDEDLGRDCEVSLNFSARYSKWETMIFGGWVRGEVKEGMSLSFTGDVEYELYCEGARVGTYTAPATLVYTLSETGVYWYEDVFGGPDIPEDEWDAWNEDLRINYGYDGD